jgi:hypothetical protein
MKAFMVGAVVVAMCGSAGVAAAQQQVQKMVSPPFPTHGGTDGACYIRNTGTKPITVTVATHSPGNFGAVVVFDNCNDGPLPAGQTCVQLTVVPDDSYAACIATAPNVGKLRGTFELRETPSVINPTLRVLVAGDLVKK